MTSSTGQPVKRRKYSRNGCAACKRRKIKCDEGTPKCGRCDHLKIECIYNKELKFKQTRKQEPVSIKFVDPIVSKRAEGLNSVEATETPGNSNLLASDSVNDILNLLESAESIIGDMAGITDTSQLPDLSRAAEGLESMNGMDFDFKLSPVQQMYAPHLQERTNSQESFGHSSSYQDYDYLNALNSSMEPMEISKLAQWLQFRPGSSRLVHFRAFIVHVNLILFPLTCSYVDSPYILVVLEAAKRCSFLLSALLASGASFLAEKAKSQLNTTNNFSRKQTLRDEIEEHESARIYYLSQCFTLLQQVLEDAVQVTDHVDGILLTSLILAADSSSRSDLRWQVHLQGAKQFLVRYSNEVNISDALIISRYIFSSLEISSGLNASLGGSLHSAEELEWLTIRSDQALRAQIYRLGLAIDGQLENDKGDIEVSCAAYNMYVGYSSDTMEVLKDMLQAFNDIRQLQENNKETAQVPPRTISKLFFRIERARRFFIVTNKSPFRIPRTSKYHPAYVGADKTRLPLSCYSRINNPRLRNFMQDGSKNLEDDCWFSFYDFLQQIHLDGVYIRILTCKQMLDVPYDSPIVQAIVRGMIDSFSFFIQLDYENVTDADLRHLESHYNEKLVLERDDVTLSGSSFEVSEPKMQELLLQLRPIEYTKYVNLQVDHRLCMFQWILLACGFCCVEAHHKLLVESLLSELNNIGVRSSAKSLQKLRKAWLERRIHYNDGSNLLPKKKGSEFFWGDEENSFPFT